VIGRVTGSHYGVVGHGSLGCLVDFMELSLFEEGVPGMACFCYGGGAQEGGACLKKQRYARRHEDMCGR